MQRNAKKGFTIVELVIVIAVIAILAAVLIPTFASLIEKANMSVDMQMVRQMNTILAAEEAVDGKPAQAAEAKAILAENGITQFTPVKTGSTFYWVGADNKVILWEEDQSEVAPAAEGEEQPATGKVTYPKDMAEKYKTVTEPSDDWANLADDLAVQILTPEEDETLSEALLRAVKDATDGAIIKLPEGAEVDLGRQLYLLGRYLTMDGGTGKKVTLDLNGGKLTGGYYSLNVPANATLEVVNGTLEMDEFTAGESCVSGTTGSHIIMRDMTVKSTGSAFYPEGTASEVVLDGCTVISEGAYGLGTNRMESSLVRVVISDSYIESKYSTALLINTSADVHVDNSTLVGVEHGIVLRAGHAEVTNSVVKATDTTPGIYSYKNFNSGRPEWLTGNALAAGTIVIGDYSSGDSYSGDAVCTLVGTKLETPGSEIIPEVVMAARLEDKVASITYDEASVVGRVVVYGEDFTYASGQQTISHAGTITVNGVAK